ncbi:trypsin-like cysteine/serine peptidase domain-containing protein [Hyaloraphidium curvatum]|nr:trypsin-like cysteine/serine peptidase domain-containing protein [Hyaloraphidium curvatum]
MQRQRARPGLAALAALVLLCTAVPMALAAGPKRFPPAEAADRAGMWAQRSNRTAAARIPNPTPALRPDIGNGGPAPPPAVFGGNPVAASSQYPFMAILLYVDPSWSFLGLRVLEYVCGATLVAPRVAMTAAQCVSFWASRGITEGVVQVGRRDRSKSVEDDGAWEFNVLSFEMHPRFRQDAVLSNDVALLYLSEPVVTGSSDLVPVPINFSESNPAPGSVVTTIGFGQTPDAELAQVLQEVNITAVSDEACTTLLEYQTSGDFGADDFHPSYLCAGNFGKSFCQGDQGSPLLQYSADGTLEQVGMVSWSLACGDTLGIYSRLPYLRHPRRRHRLHHRDDQHADHNPDEDPNDYKDLGMHRLRHPPMEAKALIPVQPQGSITPSPGAKRFCSAVQEELTEFNTPQSFFMDVEVVDGSPGMRVELYLDADALPFASAYLATFDSINEMTGAYLFTSYGPERCGARPAGLPLVFEDGAALRFLPLLEESGPEYQNLTKEEACFGDMGPAGRHPEGGRMYLYSWCLSFDPPPPSSTTQTITTQTTETITTHTSTTSMSRTRRTDFVTATIDPSRIRVCNNQPKDILDLQELNSTIQLTGIGSITDLAVELAIDHTYFVDIFVRLTAVADDNGERTVSLFPAFPGNDGCSDNRPDNIQMTFDDSAPDRFRRPNCDLTRYRPDGALASFADIGRFVNADGLWKLTVGDVQAGDDGVLHRWCLVMLPAPRSTTTTLPTVTVTVTVTASVSITLTSVSTVTSVSTATSFSTSVSSAPPVTSTVTSVSISLQPSTTTVSLAAVTISSTISVPVPTTTTVLQTQTSVVTSVSVSQLVVPVTKTRSFTKTVGKVTTTLVRTTKVTVRTTKTVRVTTFKTVTIKAKGRR